MAWPNDNVPGNCWCGHLKEEHFQTLKREIKRLRELVIELKGDPGADIFALPRLF
jgi:hypothetical protein